LEEPQMTNLNPILNTSTVNPRKDAHELLRRGFIKMSVLASGALSFWLSGCTLGEEKDVENGNSFEVIDEWIRTVNAEDVTGFENLSFGLFTQIGSLFPDGSKFGIFIEFRPEIRSRNLSPLPRINLFVYWSMRRGSIGPNAMCSTWWMT
jgi:hypothetical protein